MRIRRLRRVGAVVVTAFTVGVAMSGCSSHDAPAGDSGGGGVTLVIGDQVKSTQTLLESSGQLKDLPYKVTWASFEAGPPLLEAAAAGKVDIGATGDVPAVFAQSAGSPLKIVTTTATTRPNDFLLVPEGSPIQRVEDLRGKKVAFTKGSSSNGLVLAALSGAGLKPSDITETYLTPNEGLAAFTSGQVDAWAVWNPYAAIAQQKGKPRVLVNGGGGLTTQQGYYLASSAALADGAKEKAIADLVSRIAKAQRWSQSHRDEWVPIFSKLTTLPEPIARATFDASSGNLVPIDAAVIAKQQKLLDLFADAKVIPNHPRAADYFDARFNDRIGEGAK
ncbi:ABC transporter substrate-binding protein [Tsukamurella sp. NPDC003166]|uniref:ABC transporter substrate-binding protein n=1 Tax=Tsukamurella sp. NPDC003166 TaxID=3154444 RepID=UPI0033BF5172